MDFLAQPLGLDADDVTATAIEVAVALADGRTIPLWVMNPERCLRSRVANSSLPEKRTPLAWRQLRAAVACTRAYGLYLLDQGAEQRIIYRLNERVFQLARYDRRAMDVYLRQGIDVLDALVVDDRLSVEHRQTRLPQIRGIVEDERRRQLDLAGRRAAFLRRSSS